MGSERGLFDDRLEHAEVVSDLDTVLGSQCWVPKPDFSIRDSGNIKEPTNLRTCESGNSEGSTILRTRESGNIEGSTILRTCEFGNIEGPTILATLESGSIIRE